MSSIQRVTSLDLPALQPYCTLRRPKEHLEQGIFVAEGEKVVRRLLTSRLEVVSLLMTPDWFAELFPDSDSPPNSEVFIAERKLLETIVGYRLHQGIMAVGRVPKHRSLEDTIRSLPVNHFLVALDGLVHSENVGVIVRNCAAFGVDAIITGSTSCSPYLRRSVRNSMGAVFTMPVVEVNNLADALMSLQTGYNTKVIATDPHGLTDIASSDLERGICIVFGNEESGVSEEIKSLSDERVMIPMHNSIDSLNVASASAVVLYEARRHR
ncbi:MAG: RNA methyltransferase [Ignavibacteriae bacterium]|nr:RNA methyltransferase [Ignavibacteriota bacterium]